MLPDSYTCRCGVNNIFSSYAYANWEFIQRHFCTGCGRMNRIFEGELLSDEKETTETQKPDSFGLEGCAPAPKKSPVKKKVRPKKGKT